MKITSLAIPDIKLVVPDFLRDNRGYFVETYSRKSFAEAGIDFAFVRDNSSLSHRRGTVRGLHFQIPPEAQDKLVRVERGRIFDVAVDIRSGSPYFGRHVAAELDADSGHQLLIPKGFAHGFCTLEENTVVAYKVSGEYRPGLDKGLLWNDPDLAISWPIDSADAITSERDNGNPCLGELASHFTYAQSETASPARMTPLG